MSKQDDAIKKMEDRNKKYVAELRQAKAKIAKEQAQEYSKKCAVVGAAILAEMTEDETLGQRLNPIIDKRTHAAKDRKLIGLSPLPKKEKTEQEEEKNKTAAIAAE